MNIRHLIPIWRTIKIPGLWLIMRDWVPLLRMHFLYAAMDSGLLEALQTGATRAALIDKLNVQRPELLDALLDMGLALKELSLRNAAFSLRGKRSKVLATMDGDALAAVIQANVTYYNAAYRHLAGRLRGGPLGSDLDEIGETVARFSKIGEPILSNFIKSLMPTSGPVKIMDVGCGSGFVLKTAWQTNPKANGMGIDIDEKVAAQASANLRIWGLEDRFKILIGDIRSQLDAHQGGFDLITAFNLIYYIPTGERPDFFSLLRELLRPKGRIALVNNFQSKGMDAPAANLNIVNCSLNNLTALPDIEIIRKQLSACGFKRIQTTRFIPRSEFYGLTAYV
jgi:4-hydroxy-2,2'-bipyrrole-5-carbaldehyde O-methyltransferase